MYDYVHTPINMHLYLSSFRVGDRAADLQALARGRCLGFVPNALDFVPLDGRTESNEGELERIRDLDIEIEPLDLTKFFDALERLAGGLASLTRKAQPTIARRRLRES